MFRKLIRQYFVKSDPNFVLLDGGRLYVPDDDVDHFRHIYNDRVFKERLCVVERCTAVFPFFVDIDHASDKQPLHSSDRDYLVSIIFEHLLTSFGIDHMVVCSSNYPKMKNGKYYDGVHLHWPEVLVDKSMALCLRNHIVRKLTETVGGDWDDIVDSAVYKTGSLRMKGSHKRDDPGRYYWPVYTLRDGTKTSWDPEQNDTVIQLCSVRSTHSTPSVIPNLTDVEPPEDTPPPTYTGAKGSKITNVDPVTNMLIQRFSEYKDVQDFVVKDVVVFKNSAIIHTNCRYCLNKMGHHNSCTIYFHVQKGPDPCIYQRCFSNKVYNGQTCSQNKTKRRFYHKALFDYIFNVK